MTWLLLRFPVCPSVWESKQVMCWVQTTKEVVLLYRLEVKVSLLITGNTLIATLYFSTRQTVVTPEKVFRENGKSGFPLVTFADDLEPGEEERDHLDSHSELSTGASPECSSRRIPQRLQTLSSNN